MKPTRQLELQQLKDLGGKLHASGRIAEALKVCERILKLTPRDAYALANRAMLLRRLGQHQEALAAVDRALKQKPQLAGAHQTRAQLLLELGCADEALTACARMLRLQPASPEAHNLRGLALRELRQEAEAMAAFEQALQLKPDHAEAHNNLGTILLARGRCEAALEAFDRSLQHNPARALTHHNRGITLCRLGRAQEAVPALQQAIRLDPRHTEAYRSRAHALRTLGLAEGAVEVSRTLVTADPADALSHLDLALSLSMLEHQEEALNALDESTRIAPNLAAAHEKRGDLLAKLGQVDAAREAYHTALRLEPDAVTVKYSLAALGDGEIPPLSPEGYVTGLFDSYAERFDRELVDQLKYQAPRLLYEAVHPQIDGATAAGNLDILDLGCGTGLCGEAFANHARTLVGVDLSPLMLSKAKQRGLYTDLVQGDVCEQLARDGHDYDLILAGDLFIYIGDLARLFALTTARLSACGLLAFSIEAHDGTEDYVLCGTGRYAQSPMYIRRLAAENRLGVVSEIDATLRYQHGTPVNGRIMVLRRS